MVADEDDMGESARPGRIWKGGGSPGASLTGGAHLPRRVRPGQDGRHRPQPGDPDVRRRCRPADCRCPPPPLGPGGASLSLALRPGAARILPRRPCAAQAELPAGGLSPRRRRPQCRRDRPMSEAECDRSLQVEETLWVDRIAGEHGMPAAIVGHCLVPQGRLRGGPGTPYRGLPALPGRALEAGDGRPPRPLGARPTGLDAGRELAPRASPCMERYGLSWDLRVPAWHLEEAADCRPRLPEGRHPC